MRTRYFSKRGFAGAGVVALLGLLWLLTQFVGTEHVKAGVFKSLGLAGGLGDFTGKDKVTGPDGKIYYCRAVAYAPLFVHVDFGWGAGSLNAKGGSALYFWPMGKPTLIREFDHWDE